MKKLLLLLALLLSTQGIIIQAAQDPKLTFSGIGSGSGKIRIQGALERLPCTKIFPLGREVPVEAVPDAGSSFEGWGGNIPASTSNPVTIKVTGNMNVSVNFTSNTKTLSITNPGDGAGQVNVEGTLQTLPYTGSFPQGTLVHLEAVPDAATSSFTGWGTDLTGTTNPTTITLNGNKNVTATFTPLPKTLTINAGTGTGTGTVKVNGTEVTSFPFVQTYPYGTIVNIEAAANAATSTFTGWSGDLAGSPASTSVTMNGDKTTSAEFTLLQRTLTIEQTGTGTGYIYVMGVKVTVPYSGKFNAGQTITVQAAPEASSTSFTGWSGAVTSTSSSINITMDNDKALSADFTLIPRTLSISKTGTGSGQVKVNGTLHTLPYEGSFAHNTVVSLEAVPEAATSSFIAWGGNLSASTSSTTITMNGNQSVTADFKLTDRQLMVLENTGTGSGEIKVNDTLRVLPYKHFYPHGTLVKLEAVPDAATSSFTTWGGGLSGSTNPTTITMNGSKSVTAEFSLLSRQLMVLENTGGGSGEVKVNDTVRVLPYEHYFSHGTVVKLQAVADPLSSSFTGWSGAITGTTNPVTLTMDGDKSLSAAFTLLQRTLTISKAGTGAGRVKVNGTLYDLPYTGSFAHNTVVNLEAAPDPATSSFAAWGGALSGTGNTASITMNSDKNVTTGFTLLSRSLMVLENTGTGTGSVKVNDTLRVLPFSASYPHGTVVKLEAVADGSTSSFTAWSGSITGTTNPVNITMDQDKSLRAEFTLLKRKLMVIENTGTGTGEIKVDDTVRTLPYQHLYPHGKVVKLQAVADPSSSSFTGWSGALTGTTNPAAITMDGDKSVSAEFTLLQRTLSISKTGTGAGQVKVNGTTYTLPYEGSFAHNVVVSLEAVPEASTSSFTVWGGALSGTANPGSIKMNGNMNATVEFSLINRSLMVLENTGTGSGAIKVNDTVRTLPYSASYPHGTVVKLEAVPEAATSSFTGWGGDLSGTNNPVNLTMNSNKTVSAAFTLLKRSLVVIESTGTGSGQVKVNDTLRTLPYSASYPHGTIVKLEASADASTSSFTGWEGDLSGAANPVSITMNSDKTLRAGFTLLGRSLMALKSTGTGSGLVKVNDTVRTLPYTASFSHGSVVKLEAVPDAATSCFTGWGGGLTGSVNPVNITMTSDVSVSAGFTLLKRSLMVLESTGTGSGEIKVNDTLRVLPFSVSCPHGSVVRLEAVPGAKSAFTGWSGAAAGTGNPANFTMDQDKNVKAEFMLNQFTLKINPTGSGSGRVMVNGAAVQLPFEKVYITGTEVTVNVIPFQGSVFDGWSGSIKGKDNPLSVKVDSNMSLTASFSIIQYKLTIISKGLGTGQVRVNEELKTLPYEGQFDINEVVKLQAVPSEGNVFVSWGGDLAGTCSNPATIKMTSDRNVTVEFNSVPVAPVLISPVDQCGPAAVNPVLKWQAVQNVTNYNVQVSTDRCFKTLVIDETVTAACKQVGPLSYNTCYYWRVRAGNCAGFGKFSDAAAFRTEKQPVKAPCNLIAKAEYGKVRLFWSDSSDNESGFFIFRKEGDLNSAGIYDLLGKVDRNNTVFVDSTIKVNVTYTYKVSAFTADSVVSFSNEFTITNTLSAVEAGLLIPSDYKLFQNYPNPFNPSTVIKYYLKSDSRVKLTIFNSLGKEVAVLVNEFRHSGMNTVTFNAQDISAGVYLYRIETLEESGKRFVDVKKLLLMK